MAGTIEHSLEAVPQGTELARAEIEGVVDPLRGPHQTQLDCPADVLHIQKLVQVFSRAQHREIAPPVCVVVEQLENAQPLGPDEALRAQNAHTQPTRPQLAAKPFGLDLCLAIRTNTLDAIL